ncbi:MAG: hypothetical protein RR330_03550 [Alistipes sp.]
MKKILVLLFTALMAVSCTDSDFYDDQNYGDIGFMGGITVTNTYGDILLTGDGVNFGLVDEGRHESTLFMYNIKFASMMPAMDLVVPYIRHTYGNGTVVFNGNDLIPCDSYGFPYPEYRIRNLHGEMYNRELTISFECLGRRISYRGYII